jgi:Ca2+-binding EF-hand superfamily protein
MAVTGGDDWANVMAPLEEANSCFRPLFIGYVAFMVIGMMNVVTGLFVDQAISIASLNRRARVREKRTEEERLTKELAEIFNEVDIDGDGTLTRDEFEYLAKDERVVMTLTSLDLDFSELQPLFSVLDPGHTGEVSINDFVWGCMKLKGPAKSIDMCTLIYEFRQNLKPFRTNLERIEVSVNWISEAIASMVDMKLKKVESMALSSEQIVQSPPCGLEGMYPAGLPCIVSGALGGATDLS